MPKDGYSFTETTVALPPGPLSPWLRLAHLTTYRGKAVRDRGKLRRISDCMLMLQTQGEGWIWWEPAQASFCLPAGSVAFVPPGVLHAHAELGAHYAVHFDLFAQPDIQGLAMLHYTGREVGPAPGTTVPQVRLSQPAPGGDLVIPLISRVQGLPLWKERCERLAFLHRTRSQRRLSASLQAAEILGWAVGNLGTWTSQASSSSDETERILAVIAAIDGAGVARPWSLTALCQKAGMGRTAFWTAFRAVTGLTPHAYLETRRVEQAMHRLLETRLSIADIASEAGYQDAFHFSRVFKRVAGASPRGFRQRRGGFLMG